MRSVFKRGAVRLPGDRTCNRYTYHATALKRHYNGVAKTGIGYFIFFSANHADAKALPRPKARRHFRLQIFFPKGLCRFRVLLFDLRNRADSLLFTSTFPESRNMEASLTLSFDTGELSSELKGMIV